MLFVCTFHDAAVFAVFSFTCVIDLVSALEYDGIISGFMQFYQKTVGPSFPQPACCIVRGNAVPKRRMFRLLSSRENRTWEQPTPL